MKYINLYKNDYKPSAISKLKDFEICACLAFSADEDSIFNLNCQITVYGYVIEENDNIITADRFIGNGFTFPKSGGAVVIPKGTIKGNSSETNAVL